jgi:hypothetical protein
MSSTLCVRCGSDLVPFSYCKVCNQVVKFVCSSCNMISDERFHLHRKEVSKKDIKLLPSINERERRQILIDTVESRAIQKKNVRHEKYENDAVGSSLNRWRYYLISSISSFIKSVYDNQDQLNEQLRYSSVNLSSSYLSTFFEYLKLINNYWMKLYTHSSNKLLGNRLSSL